MSRMLIWAADDWDAFVTASAVDEGPKWEGFPGDSTLALPSRTVSGIIPSYPPYSTLATSMDGSIVA